MNKPAIISESRTKSQRMFDAIRIYLENPQGVTDSELAQRWDCSRATVWRLRGEIDNVIEVSTGHYTIKPTPELLALADAIYKASGLIE